jgi:hypothetical protein
MENVKGEGGLEPKKFLNALTVAQFNGDRIHLAEVTFRSECPYVPFQLATRTESPVTVWNVHRR